MTQPSRDPPARLSAGVKLLLFFAVVAVVGLVLPWCLKDVVPKEGAPWRQGLGVLLAVIVLLAVLLVWLVRTRGPVHAFSLVFGLLAGLCLVVDAAFALALFDYGASRDVAVAMRIVRVVPLLAALAAVGGCLLGSGGAIVWTFFHRRAQGGAPSRVRRWLPRLAVGTLVAALAVVLYGPVTHELTRRRAVLAIRAEGGQVYVRRENIPPSLGEAGVLLAWLLEPDGVPERESWLYSLASVSEVTLGKGAGDEQLAYVCDLPEVVELNLSSARITAAGLERVANELPLRNLYLQRTPVTAEGLRHLAGMTSLAHLSLHEAPIEDDALQHLAGATSLRDLALGNTPISDEGLSHLASLGLLTQLDLRGTRITDDGLRHVGQMASLRWVCLADTAVTSSGLQQLVPIQGLTALDLSRTSLTGPGLSQLAGLPALSYLNLDQARVDEASIQGLAKVGQLKAVTLNGTNVRDDWLRHLAAMNSPLLQVRLYDTEISAAGLRSLRQSLPKAEGGPRAVPKAPSLPAVSAQDGK